MKHFEEDRIIARLDQGRSREGGPRLSMKVYERASKLLQESAINPEDFVGSEFYDRDTVAADLAYVATREKEFRESETSEQREVRMLSEVLEAVIHDQIGRNKWLGSGVRSIKSSRYDDIKNGVDTIAELYREGEGATHLALAIDITFADSKSLTKKFDDIRQEIKSGQLSQVKYFASATMGFQGKLERVPRVVVGAELRHVIELSKLWMQQADTQLAQHPFQMLVLDEIQRQIDVFGAYALKMKKTKAVDAYGEARKFIKRVIRQKKKEGLRFGEWENDRVFQAIIGHLESF